MSTFNTPEIQILIDNGKKTVVKITEAYNVATNNQTVMVVQANTLMFANASKPCVVSIVDIQYVAGFANGFCQLQWVGATTNTDIANFGGRASGDMNGYMWNPYAFTGPPGNYGAITVNPAALRANSGDIQRVVWDGQPFDSYTIILTLQKEYGYANAEIGYNDNTYQP